MAIACTPATAAPAGSFSPMRRATIAVVERLRPRPTANTRLSIDSVRPTVATASAPSRPTQKTSTTAKSDSRTISSTMGMASRRMARFRLPVVKSWCEPRSASRMELQIGIGGVAAAISCVSIKACTFLRGARLVSQARSRGQSNRSETKRKGNQSAKLAALRDDGRDVRGGEHSYS